MKALRAFLKEEKQKRDELLAQKPQSLEDDADFEAISKINDEWNQKVAKIREARLKAERIAMREEIEWQLEQQMEYEEEQRRKTNELVLREKVIHIRHVPFSCASWLSGASLTVIYFVVDFRKPQNRLLFVKISMKHLSWHFKARPISTLPSI